MGLEEACYAYRDKFGTVPPTAGLGWGENVVQRGAGLATSARVHSAMRQMTKLGTRQNALAPDQRLGLVDRLPAEESDVAADQRRQRRGPSAAWFRMTLATCRHRSTRSRFARDSLGRFIALRTPCKQQPG